MRRNTSRTLSSENKVIIACAGSGKTTRLVKEALANRDRRIAIITYTNNNLREISNRFGEMNSGVPRHVDVMTWFGFLLRECARPYQRAKYNKKRIESLFFVNQQSARGIAETDTAKHYFANDELIYSDKIAKFIVECEKNSSNAVTRRLREMYTDIFIDEFQDFAGWDFNVIEMFLRSGIRITLFGDPRQNVYRTNPGSKNMPKSKASDFGINVVDIMSKWCRNGLCELESMSASYRCNQAICDFSNLLWPGLEAMTSLNNKETGHDGVFLVNTNIVTEYIRHFQPQILRYDKRANTYGFEAMNFGLAKGLQFERVLIVPTEPIKKYLKSGEISHVEKSRDKLHVAITRARHSVAFVFDGHSPCLLSRWLP